MNRKTIVVGLLALAGIVLGLAYVKGHRNARSTKPFYTSTLTKEEKDRIQKFWTLYRNAKTLQLAGDWEAAIPEYRRALDLDPRHEDSLYSLANCHFELSQFEAALGVLKQLVEVNGMSQRGYYQIAVIRACPLAEASFDLEAAQAALDRAFELNQEETGSLLRLGELALVKGDEKRAFELLALANQSNFRAVEGYYLRAYMLWKEKRPDESRDLLLEALRQSKKPKVVAGVPGEGDTRPGSVLPPTTAHEKRLIKPVWSGLAQRYPDDRIGPETLVAEFAALGAYLEELRTRVAKDAASK